MLQGILSSLTFADVERGARRVSARESTTTIKWAVQTASRRLKAYLRVDTRRKDKLCERARRTIVVGVGSSRQVQGLTSYHLTQPDTSELELLHTGAGAAGNLVFAVIY